LCLLNHHSQTINRRGEVGQRRFIRSNKADFRMKTFIWVQQFTTVVFTVWLLYVWIKDVDFGSQRSCNNLVKYVLFFASVRATATWLRVLFITNLVITACALLFSLSVIVSAYVKRLRTHKYEKLANAATEPSSIQPPTPPSQGQSKRENDIGRTALRYVHFSVL